MLTMTTATAGEKTRARRAGVAGSEEPNGRLLAAEGSRPLSSSSSSPLPRQCAHARGVGPLSALLLDATQTRQAGSLGQRPRVSCSADRTRLSQAGRQARGLAVGAWACGHGVGASHSIDSSSSIRFLSRRDVRAVFVIVVDGLFLRCSVY